MEHAEHAAPRVIDPENSANHQSQDSARNQAFEEIHLGDPFKPVIGTARPYTFASKPTIA